MNRVVRLVGRGTAAAAVALALGACDHPEFEKQRIKLGGWTQERMLADGWLTPPYPPAPRVRCHETLADRECYLRRLPKRPPAAPSKDE